MCKSSDDREQARRELAFRERHARIVGIPIPELYYEQLKRRASDDITAQSGTGEVSGR